MTSSSPTRCQRRSWSLVIWLDGRRHRCVVGGARLRRSPLRGARRVARGMLAGCLALPLAEDRGQLHGREPLELPLLRAGSVEDRHLEVLGGDGPVVVLALAQGFHGQAYGVLEARALLV